MPCLISAWVAGIQKSGRASFAPRILAGMKKLIAFVIELILAPLLMGAILIKYPGTVDWLIRWASFLILWHLTWQAASSFKRPREFATSFLRNRRFMAWICAFVAGGLISVAYMYSIRLGMKELGRHSVPPQEEASKTSQAGIPTTKDSGHKSQPLPRSNSVFDSTIAEWRIKNAPFDLTLHDLFLTDFRPIDQVSMGAIFVDPDRKISVQYAILISLSTRSKFLAFYVPKNVETAKICATLANDYNFVLNKTTQVLITEKEPGSSGTVSTKEAIFTRRIYIYHETYLDTETTAKLMEFYSRKGLSVILRSVDYLYTKKLEYRVRENNGTQK